MAANPPPFQVEDNSDEDFFDKLVNDDDDTDFNVTGVVMDGDESDDARAFANLNINEHVDNGELSFDATGSSTSHDVGVSSTEIHDVPQISEVGTVGGSRNGMVTSDSFLFDKLMVDQADKGGANEESGSALLSSNSFEFDNLVHGHENVTGPTEGLSDATVVSKSSNDCLSDATAVGNNSVESAAPGVKQVDWSAFHSDSGQTAGNGFGSFSDFFDGENAGDAFESIVGDGLHNGPQIANVDNVHAPAPLENSTYTGQNDAYSYGVTADQSASYGVAADQSASYGVTADQSANPVYQNSNQSWDNLYPGWKYNQYTGEWYQVDGSDASASVSSHSDPYLSSGWGVSAGQAEVSYLQQNPYSAAGTVAEVGTVQSVTNWNQPSQVSDPVETTANWGQVSQAIVDTTTAQSQWNQASQDNNGYPQHMAFDPQYPGWYYNTITQQWCQLESYTVPTQSATQTQEQMHQSEFQSNDIYTQNNKQVSNSQTTYNAHGEGNSYMSQAFGKQGQDQNYSAHGEGNNFMSQGFGKQGQDQNYSAHGEGKSYMSQGFGKQGQDQNYSAHGEGKSYMSQGFGKQGQDQNWSSPGNSYNHQPTVWQPEGLANSDPTSLHSGSHLKESHYGQAFPKTSGSKQISSLHGAASSYYENVNQVQNNFSVPSNSQSFHVGNNLSQVANDSRIKQNEQMHTSYENYNNQNSFTFSQHEMHKAPVSNNHALGRSSAGRPAHALAAFGFGGKLIMMKHNSSSENLSFGTQNPVGKYLSVLNLADVIKENVDASHNGMGVYNYFQALGRQSVPGPLTGGSVGTKELNKWIDERTANPVSLDMDYRKAEVLRLLLSLLRISCQYYGKLRSPYGSDAALKEIDAPELAVARLFASAKGNVSQLSQYGPQCLQQMPSEDQMQVSAAEVQSLLVSGKKKDALQCAQEGQLWGPALVLAAQLGDQFYVETVKQMALRQLVAGSPLRTLCLLIAGQPKDVFSADCSTSSSVDGVGIMPQQPAQAGVNIMLDDWEENLAVITANGTKGDDLVLLHLGDCLWKERSNVTAAHICYLVAEASFEHYSDSARLCLVGADHWKFPRTYASPEAIQRTEIYEYSKTLGNSQFVLLPFQPYKLVYAHMLAEVGRVSDALKYVQAVLKSLKTGRTAEVETLKHLASSLEERIKAHQQGGFSTNLAGSKLVGKLLNLFDSTASRVVGGLPPPAPALAGNVHGTENHFQPIGPRVSTSQSTLAMSSLVPSQSAEPVNSDNNKVAKHTRSVSEPDFGRTPRQGQTDSVKDASSTESKASTSRFRRFGLGYLQKTVGAVLSRPGRQAKLGDENKFYYDAKLGRWVEEGSEIPAEEAALPPPPPTAGFQNGTSDYNLKSALQTEVSQSNGSPEFKGPSPMDNNPGMPPLPPSTNQYSARGRIGVRSRYVDTFNQGGGNSTNSFQSPPSPSIKPLAVPKPTSFFMPAPLSPTVEQPIGSPVDNAQLMSPTQDYSPSSIPNNPPHSPAPLSSVAMQRFASMNNISMNEMRDGGSFTANSRRTASWGGNMNNSLFSPPPRSEARPLGEVLGMDSSSFEQPGSGHSRKTSGSYGDEMQEVDL